MQTTERTGRVFLEGERSEIGIHGAIEQKPAYEWFSFLQYELEGLRGLHQANLSRDHAQDAYLASGRYQFLLRWARQHAPQARPALFRIEDARLPFRSYGRAKNVRLALKEGSIIKEILGLKIVRAIKDDVEISHNANCICPGEAIVKSENIHVRVDSRYSLSC